MENFFAKYEISLNTGHALDVIHEKLEHIRKKYRKGKDVEEDIKELSVMVSDLVDAI